MEDYSNMSYILEFTELCNNRCSHCYNIWKMDGYKEKGKELTKEEWKKVIKKLKEETDCKTVAITGGEPTLRPDFLEILQFIDSLGIISILITNGTGLSKDFIKNCIDRGVRLFELPLLGPTREIHNEISGNDCWDNVIEAVIEIKSMNARPVMVFVATNKNIPYFEETLKLAIALDTGGMMLNRFNPGGEGIKHMDELIPSAEDFEQILEIANRLSFEYRYPVSCSIPIHPCIINMSKYPYLGTGFCAAGTDRAYYTISPQGMMRPCNHSPTILGNFLTEKFVDMIHKPVMKEFADAIPPICEPCPMARECQGGCKATAEVCYGSIREMDPFLKKNLHRHPLYRGKGEMQEAPVHEDEGDYSGEYNRDA